jgi:hypothetical protein
MVDRSRSLTLGKQQYSLDHIPTLFVATKSDLDLAQQVGSSFILRSDCVTSITRTRDTRCSQMCTAEDLAYKYQLPLA